MSATFVVVTFVMAVIFPPGLPVVQTDEPVVVEIISPVPGQALQGNIPIIGTIRTTGYVGGELLFSYEEGSRDSWFEIGRIPLPQEQAELGVWDTTRLTDGNYTLRLTVTLVSGESVTTTVSGLRVRNYSIIETSTPAPSDTPPPIQGPTEAATALPTATGDPPTPTSLPQNPGELTPSQLSFSAFQGILVTLAAFAVLGFLALRRRFR